MDVKLLFVAYPNLYSFMLEKNIKKKHRNIHIQSIYIPRCDTIGLTDVKRIQGKKIHTKYQ